MAKSEDIVRIVGTLTLPIGVREQLDKPFEGEEVRQDAYVRNDAFQPKYPAAPALIRRLNEVFGHVWSDKVLQIWDAPDGSEVMVHVRLSVPIAVGDHIVMVEKDGIGRAMLRFGSDGRSYSDYGNRVKAAHTDALRKAATKFGVSLHLYETDEAHFQGMERLARPDQKQLKRRAPRYQVQQVIGLLETKYHIEREAWMRSLSVSSPEQLTVEQASQLLDGSHPYVAQLGAREQGDSTLPATNTWLQGYDV